MHRSTPLLNASRHVKRAFSHASSTHHRPGEFTLGSASLFYRPLAQGRVLQVTRTHLPPSEPNDRAAEQLCHAAFSYARSHRLLLLPSCEYVSDVFLPRHEEAWGDVALRSYDESTPGLLLSLSRIGVGRVELTDERRRNPLSRGVLQRLAGFLRECCRVEPTQARGSAASEDGMPPALISLHVKECQDSCALSTDICALCTREKLLTPHGPVFSSGHDFSDFAEKSSEEQRHVLDLCSEVNALLQARPAMTANVLARSSLVAIFGSHETAWL
ncbi:MAG: hypothetical protein SGPRY_006187 [Prymnesium sp.]